MSALADRPDSAPSVVQVEHVWTRFGRRVVHRDISLSLRRGEILGVVGASGSGKTTLLREVLGLRQPDEGRIRVLGIAWSEAPPRLYRQLRNRCGVLYQGGALFSALSVYENIAFPLRELRILDEELIGLLVSIRLRMVDLGEEVAPLLPAELSGGMVKRVALARALAVDPELLFLDEPTSGLDPIGAHHFVRLIRRLHREFGFSLLMITHELDTLVRLCDRVAVLADQRVAAIGSIDEVCRSPHPFVQEFFNEPGRRHVFTGEALDE
jgi:phospholipid/cholesterol/gamma-HCH transport system ATP-binding protein